MCGIVALFETDGRPVERGVLSAMTDSMSHRGPDDSGLLVDGAIGLGHRRLSVIDLEGGHQPLSVANDTVWISYNGEIYNFPELRRQAESEGFEFRTKSDTEVILALYLLRGDAFVEELNGIFTFAIWDARQAKMLLVRDRMGVKPFYLWTDGGLVAAASEVKALLRHPRIAPSVDEGAIAEYLAFRQLAGGRTLLRGIRAMPPGTILTIQNGRIESRSYWTLPAYRPNDAMTEVAAADRLGELLEDATRMQLISDVPLGTFASGGVDSSLVTSFVAERTSGELNTFCIGLDEAGFDERAYSQQVADRFGTKHHVLVASSTELAEALPRVIWHHDLPLTHPNTLPIWALSRLAKEHVTVVLTGEGCDEFFGGYRRYRIGALMRRLGRSGRGLASLLAGAVPAPAPVTPGGKLVGSLRHGRQWLVCELSRYVSDGRLEGLLANDFATVTSERLNGDSNDGDWVADLLRQDQIHYLQPLLDRLDKATMAFGLEARVPFLDHRILEFSATVPSSLKVTLTGTKRVVKRLGARRLPREVVYRKKSGLALPLRAWLRDENGMGRHLETLLEPRSLERGYFRPAEVRRLVECHRSGEEDHAELLWALINLEIWQQAFERDLEVCATAPLERGAATGVTEYSRAP